MSISAPPRMVNELRAILELRARLTKQAAQRDPAQPSTSPVDSLLAYAQHMDRRYQPSWHHLAIIEKLEAVERGDIKRLMITMPPRHGKSLTVNLFSAWYLGRNPDHRIIATSYGQVLADRFSGQARSQIEDDRWPFRDVQLAQDTRSKRAWDLKGHYGGYLAAGVGAGITGHGAQLIIVDDPIRSDKDAKSAHIRDALWEWYTATLSTRLEEDGATIVIQTRWHQDDLAGRLLRGDDGEDEDFPEGEREDWVLLNLPAIALSDEEHREEGEALWPQRYPVSRLNRRHRLIGDYYWNALYQQTPTPAEGAIFQRPWFAQRFDPTDLSIRNRASVRTITIDTAQKESASADYSAFCVGEMVGAEGQWTLYLREVERERLTFPKLVDRTVQLATRHSRDDKLGAVVIEDSANGSALIDELRASAPEWLANIVVPVRPRASKTIRAERITPLCRAGKVILPAPSEAVPWLYGFESELFDFPVAPHDDQVDAFVMLVDHWTHYLHEPYQLEEAA